jgi:CBS domain-containing protein
MVTAQHLLDLKGDDVWTISPEDTVYDALRLMARVDIGALLVMEGDDLVGILSERDYARKIVLLGKASRDTKVREIMTSRVFSIHPLQTIEECMDLMTQKRIRHVPVVLDEKVIGVISIGDVVKHIIHKQRETIKDLTNKISSTQSFVA